MELIDHYQAEDDSELINDKALKPIKKQRLKILGETDFVEAYVRLLIVQALSILHGPPKLSEFSKGHHFKLGLHVWQI